MMNFGAVIVTYNRCDKLINTLTKFDAQLLLPKYIIVVNNASTDNTSTVLKSWANEKSNYERIVVSNDINTGGSGGFYTGLKIALDKEADWIWVSDDDAYPEKDALLNAYQFLSHSNENISALCGSVYLNGNIDTGHRRRITRKMLLIYDKEVDAEEYKKQCFEINEFSYVGAIINKYALRQVGITNKDYFIHYDDTEHSLRLAKVGKIYCVPSIKIIHDIQISQDRNSNSYNSSWQKYYDYRNLLDMYRRRFPKYCYKIQLFKYYIKLMLYPVFGMKRSEALILKDAIHDFKNNKFGESLVYRPGYKPR